MERTLSHLAPAHASSGSLPADGAHTTRKLARAGAHSPGSSSRGRSGLVANDVPAQSTRARQLEGVLSKYTNLIQGWQNRYFVLDPDLSQLQYFVNEQGRGQKPRGTLPLIGASVTPSDETPHMFIVSSANGELFKLRAVDVKEQQLWMTQLQACTRPHSDGSTKVSPHNTTSVRKLKDSEDHLYEDGTASLDTQVSSGRTRSFSLLPHIPPSSSPGLQRHLGHGGGHSGGHGGGPSNIVTITHHKSPAAARRAKQQYPGRLLEVREVMSQAEAQQRTLVQSIEELPRRGSVSCLDQDLLLLKATSAATLSCLGDCLSILQHSHAQTGHAHARAPPSGESTMDALQTAGVRGPLGSPVSECEVEKGQGELNCVCPYISGHIQLSICSKCC